MIDVLVENDAIDLEYFFSTEHLFVFLQMRSKVLADFSKVDSQIRLLLATEAFSMGTDVPDIRQVIHAGVPTTLESMLISIFHIFNRRHFETL